MTPPVYVRPAETISVPDRGFSNADQLLPIHTNKAEFQTAASQKRSVPGLLDNRQQAVA
jgi:hypothetical protein